MNVEKGASFGTLTIDQRFNGPPTSGNGGYVCGELAKAIDRRQAGALESGVRVRLRQPPALEKELEIAETQDGCGLFDDGVLVAQAWPEPLELSVPDSVSFDTAREATHGFRGYDEHPFPGCFVCGPERAEGDGLRIFPGAVPGSAAGVFASPWLPDPTLADLRARSAAETVDPAFIWAALDCPGAFCFPQPTGAFILLGEMTAAIHGDALVGEACVLLSWEIGQSGRKHMTGTAAYNAAGECLGRASALWIEVATD